MEFAFVLLLIVIVLAVGGILFYRFRQPSEDTSFDLGQTRANQYDPASPPVNDLKDKEKNQLPPDNSELLELRGHLNTIVMHNDRVYNNNIEIARKDFVKRGIQNPSEVALLKRAIEIWQDDNR